MISLEEYQRYGRQMILDGFGLPGQEKLRQASVVVVGAGGLGCPALQYLGATGIGRIGIIDHDRVELSNLQRQILHSEETVGMFKAGSAALALKKLNSHLTIDCITTALTPQNAVTLLRPYDVILDCTDNVPTRYLLSDTAVVLGKPLVSGAAQKYDGQLCIYNLSPDGPCYRCLFPRPPAPETVGSCAEMGILGVVTGIIGNMQALETIKILTGLNGNTPSLLLFSALGFPQFRNIKLRSRKPTCPACGKAEDRVGAIEDIDYVQFCGGPVPNWEQRGFIPGDPDTRISAQELRYVLTSGKIMTIIDVRPETEFGICQLPSSINVPLKSLVANPKTYLSEPALEIYVVCRLGNDSQIAAEALRSVSSQGAVNQVKDLIGGLVAWSKEVDANFPIY